MVMRAAGGSALPAEMLLRAFPTRLLMGGNAKGNSTDPLGGRLMEYVPGKAWLKSGSCTGNKDAAGARAVLGQVWTAEHVQAVT